MSLVVEIALDVIGYQDHHDVGGFGGFGRRQHLESGGFGFGAALAAGGQADHHVEAGIAQVQRVRVALAAVADDGDFLAFEVRRCFRLFRKSVLALRTCRSYVLNSRLSCLRRPRGAGTGGCSRSFLASSDMAIAPERVTSISP